MGILPVMNATRWSAIALVFFLAACAEPVRLPTASGNPEITIPNADPDEVAGQLTDRFVTAGYQVADAASLRRLVFERAIDDSPMHTMLLGSTHNPFPTLRITATVNRTGNSVRAILLPEYVSDAGAPFERRLPARNTQDLQALQALLDSIRSDVSTDDAGTSEPVAAASAHAARPAALATGGGNGFAPKAPPSPPRNDYTARQISRSLGCDAPVLLGTSPSTETFQAACPGGQYKLISCEFTNCRVMQ